MNSTIKCVVLKAFRPPPLLLKVVPTQPRETKIQNFSVASFGDWRADRDERLENEFRVLQKISNTIADRVFCVD